jgi:hypothetical protein
LYWSIVQTSDKSSKFSPLDLAIYITDIFKTTYEVDVGDDYVRSVSSCKRDLIKWGFYLGDNSNRPYYEGHEREDVVLARKDFVEYFNSRKHLYYTLTNNPDDKNDCEWIIPMKQEDGSRRVALFSHDESTYRRGEVSKKKMVFSWL